MRRIGQPGKLVQSTNGQKFPALLAEVLAAYGRDLLAAYGPATLICVAEGEEPASELVPVGMIVVTEWGIRPGCLWLGREVL